MSSLRSDMSKLGPIYPSWGPNISEKTGSHAAKSRSRAKMMNLGPDKLTTCKLNTIEFREIRRTTRRNRMARNHT
jgi:hypothetical protein